MKRRNFIKASALVAGTAAAGKVMANHPSVNNEKEIYEWRVFHFKNNAQKNRVEKHYREALIPFLNEMGIKVGAFGEYGLTEPPSLYFLHVFESMSAYHRVKKAIWKDKRFLEKSKTYFDGTAENGSYSRFETSLLEAFDGIPIIHKPGNERSLFELRTYESNNEEAGQRKIKMFNNEELPLFEKVGLHPVFFGEILAGPQMPSLVYMLWFKNMEERTANWNKFSNSKEWNEMKNKPEYANTVSVVNKKFLLPLDYSQI